ncbi:ATP-binding protein [Paenibacillus rhizoplanae]
MPDGGTITLEHHQQDDSVVIVITDEGGGVPEEMLPKLGEPFFTNKESGTGLGLMVSQRIIQAHKGSLEIRSEYGRGAQVIIKLPEAKEPAPPAGMNIERSEDEHENQ